MEREARRRKISLSAVLDLAARAWLDKNGADADDAAEQRRLHAAAAKAIGTIRGQPRTARMSVKSSGSGSLSVMVADALADTGAIVALLNREDRWHQLCTESLTTFRLPLVTSEAVLSELFHFAAKRRRGIDSAWAFVRSGALKLAEIQHSELPEIHALMSQYRDRPMDFADATLVYLAKRESLSTIFTVDHADFETYRIDGRRRFRILPSGGP